MNEVIHQHQNELEKFKKLKEIERKKEENEFDLGKRKKERKKSINE